MVGDERKFPQALWGKSFAVGRQSGYPAINLVLGDKPGRERFVRIFQRCL